jgi:hypothetical protein
MDGANEHKTRTYVGPLDRLLAMVPNSVPANNFLHRRHSRFIRKQAEKGAAGSVSPAYCGDPIPQPLSTRKGKTHGDGGSARALPDCRMG